MVRDKSVHEEVVLSLIHISGDVATIAPGVTIGDRAVIGPKAMVYNDVEEGQEQC